MMGVLSWLRKRPDPLAELRHEPTPDQRRAERELWQQQDIEDALRDGECTMSGYSNCGPRSRGYSLQALVNQGLMRCDYFSSLQPGGLWLYSLTEAGQQKRRDLTQPKKGK